MCYLLYEFSDESRWQEEGEDALVPRDVVHRDQVAHRSVLQSLRFLPVTRNAKP